MATGDVITTTMPCATLDTSYAPNQKRSQAGPADTQHSLLEDRSATQHLSRQSSSTGWSDSPRRSWSVVREQLSRRMSSRTDSFHGADSTYEKKSSHSSLHSSPDTDLKEKDANDILDTTPHTVAHFDEPKRTPVRGLKQDLKERMRYSMAFMEACGTAIAM